jgi:hypothetical protein
MFRHCKINPQRAKNLPGSYFPRKSVMPCLNPAQNEYHRTVSANRKNMNVLKGNVCNGIFAVI